MHRRTFLKSSAGGLLAASVAAHCESAAGQATPSIIDTHTHFYDPTRPEGVPWPGKNDQRLFRRVLPEEFQRLAKPLGIAGTIVVEASPWVEDNQWLLDLAAKDPFLLGIVGNLDPKSDTFERHVRRFAANKLFRGIRVSSDALVDNRLEEFVGRSHLLIDHGLELDVNGGPEMPLLVARLSAKLPKLRIVINHAANLRIDGQAPPRGWVEGMTAAARHANVFCKVSALVEHTATKPAPRDVGYYRPVLDTLWKLWGEDRLIFGSNWPVADLGAPLDAVVGIVRDYFQAKSERAAAKFFLSNSKSAYEWEERT